MQQRQSTTQLSLSLQMTNHPASLALSAGFALLGSSLVGLQMDKVVPSSGILATLMTAAMLSNVGLVPSAHYLYDLCWTTFLPASLALLLLAYRNSPMSESSSSFPSKNTTTMSTQQQQIQQPVAKSIRTVALPFFISSIGSLVGCWTSFVVFSRCPSLGLSLVDARVACACMSASLVGGSVNFFATAQLIRASPTLMGSLATSDLMVLAVYFAFLTFALQNPFFRRLFSNNNKQDVRDKHSSTETSEQVAVAHPQSTTRDDETRIVPLPSSSTNSISTSSRFQKFQATGLITALALAVVQVANRVERFVGPWIPGTACAVIALVAPAMNSFFVQRLDGNQMWNHMQTMGSPLSELFFHFLFASIGTNANLKEALVTGPACLGFSSLAYGLHVILTFAGNYLVKQKWKAGHQIAIVQDMELEDVLIASNAAIGGPATAAAFCGRMQGPRLRGWTMAATVWGVFGYAIGTMLGVGMFRLVGGQMI
jgi:uncharacterized membrane protein